MLLSWGLVIFGLVGVLGMTWLFPLLARVVFAFHRPTFSPRATVATERFAILIPSHNDATHLERTLLSVRRAIERVREVRPELEFSVRVGVDGCTDRTEQVASRHGAIARVNEQRQGKWNTLRGLLKGSDGADWIVLADSGIEWPEDFLCRVLPDCERPEVIALAPTYHARDGGLVERALWSIERHFKNIETATGGPVSIHGATVLYRKAALDRAFEQLGEQSWLNDDVVIPLMLRSTNPGSEILYASGLEVQDRLKSSEGASPREFTRRRRLVFGNIQWIRGILPYALRNNEIVACLALRRVFRLFWAYWGLALAFGIPMLVLSPGNVASLVVGALGLSLILILRFRTTALKLIDSAAASLLAPYYLFAAPQTERTTWK